MGNALKRAERLKHETIPAFTGTGETFVDADEPDGNRAEPDPSYDVPTTFSVDPRADKLAKMKAIRAQADAFKALLREYGQNREFAIARQRIEEAVHWARDGVILHNWSDEDERPAEMPK